MSEIDKTHFIFRFHRALTQKGMLSAGYAFLLSLFFAPMLFVLFAFIPIFGQLLVGLALLLTFLLFVVTRSIPLFLGATLGSATFGLLVFILGRKFPQLFEVVFGFELMFGVPKMVVFILTVSVLLWTTLHLRTNPH